MSLGEANFKKISTGGQSRVSADKLARSIVGLGCSPLATPNVLVAVGSPSDIPALLDSGELAEWAALTARQGQTRYVMPVNPSQPGGVSASVTHAGTGSGAIAVTVAPHKAITVKCVTGGAIATAAFQFSIDGGVTYGPTVTSTGSAPWVYMVPGTYCTLSFAAATYVATKTLTVGTDGTVTPGSAWVGTVTQASSPIDSYEFYAVVKKAGALGVATLSLSLDNGRTTVADTLIPSAGVIVVAGTGLVLTCSSTFVAGDTYSFVASPPGFNTTDLNNALTALKAVQHVQFTQVHAIGLPASAAGAFTNLATLDAAASDAFKNYQLDWDTMCECPSSLAALGFGDVITSGGAAIRDSADTDTVITAARSTDTNQCGMHVGTYPIVSPLTSRQVNRPLGWAVADRYVDTDPRESVAALQPYGPLRITIPPGVTTIGRDEYKTPGLDDVQLNTARTYRGRGMNVFLSITAGGNSWKNATTDVNYQNKGFLRSVNTAIALLRPVAQDILGQTVETNSDGTIAETPARSLDLKLSGSIQRFLGILPGGDFQKRQVSAASATVSRSSQLGVAPKRLDVSYAIQALGEVTDEQNTVTFSGAFQASA
jgi:hypothetical protein